MRFDWDERKAAANRLKHGVAFEEAITAFDDPFALIAPDAHHSTVSEQRMWLIGEADTGVVIVGVHNSGRGRSATDHQCARRQPEGAQAI